MQKFQDVIVRNSGSDKGVVPVEGASVLVQSYPGAVTSTLYSDDGITPQTNPLTTDSEGRFSFYAADGRYQLVISGTLIANQTITDVLLEDPEDGSVGVFSDLTAMNSLTLSAMTAGSILFAGVGGLVSQDNANLNFNDSTNVLTVGGQIQAANGSTGAPGFSFVSWPTTGFFTSAGAAKINADIAGGTKATLTSNQFRLVNDELFGWASGDPDSNTLDTTLARDAADSLAQRRGANAQIARIYKTFTDAANYERLTLDAAAIAGDVIIRTEQAGTGGARRLMFGVSGGRHVGLDTSGNLIAQTDNTIDFGNSGAARPRTVYVATSVDIGTSPSTSGALRIPNNQGINARNAANSGNIGLIQLDASDRVVISSSGNDILWNRALVALGGGSVPTLGTIGGTGPATAAQNTWMRVIDSTGAAFWVPAWK